MQHRSLFTYLSELIIAHTRGDPFPALAYLRPQGLNAYVRSFEQASVIRRPSVIRGPSRTRDDYGHGPEFVEVTSSQPGRVAGQGNVDGLMRERSKGCLAEHRHEMPARTSV